jgi:hypothetical protein
MAALDAGPRRAIRVDSRSFADRTLNPGRTTAKGHKSRRMQIVVWLDCVFPFGVGIGIGIESRIRQPDGAFAIAADADGHAYVTGAISAMWPEGTFPLGVHSTERPQRCDRDQRRRGALVTSHRVLRIFVVENDCGFSFRPDS